MYVIPLTAREPFQGIWGVAEGFSRVDGAMEQMLLQSTLHEYARQRILEEAPPIHSSRRIPDECCFVRLCPCRSTRPLSTHCSRPLWFKPRYLGTPLPDSPASDLQSSASLRAAYVKAPTRVIQHLNGLWLGLVPFNLSARIRAHAFFYVSTTSLRLAFEYPCSRLHL